MSPASLGVPSTLNTGMGVESLRRLNRQLLAYCRSMSSPVAPLSNSERTDFLSAVSVVSISTFNLSEVGPVSIVAMTSLSGNFLSHLGRRGLCADQSVSERGTTLPSECAD